MKEETRFTIQDNIGYLSAVENYLKNGIDFTANTIWKVDKGDVEQLAMDSFCEGAQFVLDAIKDELFTVKNL